MSKHTPGPWRVQPYNWSRGNVSVFAPRFGRAPYGACVAYTPCSAGVGGADGALANAHLIAAAPDMHEALHIQHACGAPEKVSLYDEEGVEGWRWTHPDGREWTAAGAWDEAPPMHPVVRVAIAKAAGEQA